MRILHVITSLRIGGAEKLMVDLLPRLRNLGHVVELCVFDGIRTPFFDALEDAGIKIYSFGTNGSVYNPLHISHLARLMKDFDLVHTHNTAPQLFAAIASLCTRKPKLVTTEHNTTNRRRDHWVLKLGDLCMYHKYCSIICISEQAKSNLEQYLGSSSKICTIYNGIDVNRYMNVFVPPKTVDNTKIITMVSAFRVQKDHRTLIKAFNLLPNNYILQLVGDGDLRSETEQFAYNFSCADRIRFLGNRSDVPEFLKSSDVVVLSSHYEGLSLSSIEGMACGRPFIASDVEGLHEIVNGYGILFPHQDERALADAIIRVTFDEEYAARISAACVERAKQYDISVMAERYNEVYKSL